MKAKRENDGARKVSVETWSMPALGRWEGGDTGPLEDAAYGMGLGPGPSSGSGRLPRPRGARPRPSGGVRLAPGPGEQHPGGAGKSGLLDPPRRAAVRGASSSRRLPGSARTPRCAPNRAGHPPRAPAQPRRPGPQAPGPCRPSGSAAPTFLGFLPPGQGPSEFPQEGVIFLAGRGRLGSGGLGDRGRLLRGGSHGGGAGSRGPSGTPSWSWADAAGGGGTEAAAFQTEAELFQAFEAAHARLSLPSLPPSRRPPPWKELCAGARTPARPAPLGWPRIP